MKSCETCEYWRRYGFSEAADRQFGDCRKHAPTRDARTVTIWPVTLRTDGCGDHQQKADA